MITIPRVAMTRSLQVMVATLLALATMTAAPALAAPDTPSPTPDDTAGVGIQLLEAPVALQDDPRAHSYIVDNLPPGTEISRKIEVTNQGTTPQKVALYPGAASISESGFEIQEGAAVNELTTWMSVTPESANLDPGESVEATVKIAVPKDAPEGEQYAVVWAQTGPPVQNDDPTQTVSTVSRVGIRTYLSVGPGNGPAADFTIDTVTASRNETGAPQVSVNFTNTGGRAIDPRGTLTLTDGPGGISTAELEGAGPTVAPGQRGSVTFALDPEIPAGPWTASAEITSGVLKYTTDASLTFPDEGYVTATQSGPTDTGGLPAWGWAAIIGGLVLLAGIITAVLLVRRNNQPGN